MAITFRGGVHPRDMKQMTSKKPIQALDVPERLYFPMSMHIGAPVQPLVAVGDRVLVGQKIADSQAAVSSPIHSSVSGTVKSIEAWNHPVGNKMETIIVENDFQDELSPDVKPRGTVGSLTSEEIIDIIRDSGIVGLGGAMFPTHVKIRSGLGTVDTIIINSAECEPYITSDHRVLLEYPDEVLGGAEALMKVYGVRNLVIAVEENKPDVIKKYSEYIKDRSGISICSMKTKYPQGAEKQIINAVTGREVPSGKLPSDVGCAVFNTDTAAAIYRAITTGLPVIRRIVTVSGSAVSSPGNYLIRIGTPLEFVFEKTGGFKKTPSKITMGGPMMGLAQFALDAPVIKGTNALLAFCKDEDKTAENPVCIRCGKCVSVCPMRLTPIYMYMYASKDRLEDCEKMNVLDCMECGACSYICPGRLHLVQAFKTAKQRILANKRK